MKIEGKNAVRELLKSQSTVEKLLASNKINEKVFNDIITLAKQKKVKIQFVDNATLNKNSSTSNHQGLIAFVSEYKYCEVEDILQLAQNKNELPFVVILDEIEDPHNFGSIIRVCECLGVHGIIISKNRSCPVNETVIKVSTGATSYVKIAKVTNINYEIEKLKEKGVWVYGVELGGQTIYETNLTGSIALVIGSEGKGISPLTKKLCDVIVTIPMFGSINSLNASVAGGISIYEVSKQRMVKKD